MSFEQAIPWPSQAQRILLSAEPLPIFPNAPDFIEKSSTMYPFHQFQAQHREHLGDPPLFMKVKEQVGLWSFQSFHMLRIALCKDQNCFVWLCMALFCCAHSNKKATGCLKVKKKMFIFNNFTCFFSFFPNQSWAKIRI